MPRPWISELEAAADDAEADAGAAVANACRRARKTSGSSAPVTTGKFASPGVVS